MMNADGVPTACEDDFHSLLMLYLSQMFTGKPGWIGNPSGISDSYLRFAHCTIAPVLGRECRLMSHFETGYPYAVTCVLSGKKYIFGRISLDYNYLEIYKGKIIASGPLESDYCRTQVLIDITPLEIKDFINKAIGNHHVFMLWRDELIGLLEAFVWWMNWKIKIRN